MRQLQNNYKVILWDFDGVILDSMSIRDLGFIKTLESFSKEKVDKLLEYHRSNGGLSRYVKFRYFHEEILGQSITDEEVQNLANRFSEVMLSLLINPQLLIQDSIGFIKENYLNYRFHIVSGSDGNELRTICNGLGIEQFFLSIEGSPTPKIELVKALIEREGYLKSDLCLIGDSKNDFEAAKENSIDFIGFNNEDLRSLDYYIDSFITN